VARIGRTVVGRRRECEVAVAALMSGRHLLLEGPPGTGKSTILRSIADAIGIEMDFVEGNAELTPARLIGHFDPAQVLEQGYRDDIWIDGPLARALRHGHLLYLEEINRIPEETLNLLVTVMSEQELTIPRLGRIKAEPGFRLVAAMNPYDSIGTARISAAIYDRICRLAVDYQSFVDEVDITRRQSNDVVPAELTEMAVTVVRALRDHPEVRIGPSVRGAIDLVLLADGLAQVRSVPVVGYELGLDAALVALSGRLQLHDPTSVNPEGIVSDVWADVWQRFRSSGDTDVADTNVADTEVADAGGDGRPTAAEGKAPGRRAAHGG
jgi:MoxR-like ATPase